MRHTAVLRGRVWAHKRGPQPRVSEIHRPFVCWPPASTQKKQGFNERHCPFRVLAHSCKPELSITNLLGGSARHAAPSGLRIAGLTS